MSIKITPSRLVKATFRDVSGEHTTPLVLSKWTLIGTTFAYHRTKVGEKAKSICYITIGEEVKQVAIKEDVTPENPQYYPDSDQVLIGGTNNFIGAIGKIDIFSPGAIPLISKIFVSSVPEKL